MVERIRDATVAEGIAAEAGTDATPELVLSEIVTPVILLQQRPPLAVSGYLAGAIGVTSPAAVGLRSHAGIFISGNVGEAIGRVNYIIIHNSGLATGYSIRRVDTVVGFPSTRAVPGYINAGSKETGKVFSIIRNNTAAAQGTFMAGVLVPATTSLLIPGPFIINNGVLLVAPDAGDIEARVTMGYEVWPAIRVQPQG